MSGQIFMGTLKGKINWIRTFDPLSSDPDPHSEYQSDFLSIQLFFCAVGLNLAVTIWKQS